MWIALLVGMSALALSGAVYLVFRFHKFSFIEKLAEKNKVLSWLVCLLPIALLCIFFIYNVYTVVVVLVHLVLFSLIVDLITLIVSKAAKKKIRYDVKGSIAVCLTVLYIGMGFFMSYHVFRTEYTLLTDKEVGEGLRVVMLADSHLGITLDGERFAEQMERVNEEHPDVVLIVGDYVDDDSSKEDMLRATEALGKLQTTYGVYFVFGNHDNGYFNYRDYTGEELREELKKNGVTVLEDEAALIADTFYIIGRRDRSMRNRAEAQALIEGLDESKYMIMLNHQPNDYVAEAKTGADLVLSGHTHGGHIFPAGLVGLWMGANDRVYGSETRDNTTFIVTSGISGWALPLKTGTFSEYVVIDILPNT